MVITESWMGAFVEMEHAQWIMRVDCLAGFDSIVSGWTEAVVHQFCPYIARC